MTEVFIESQLVVSVGPLRVGEVAVVAGVVRGVHEHGLHGERLQILHGGEYFSL